MSYQIIINTSPCYKFDECSCSTNCKLLGVYKTTNLVKQFVGEDIIELEKENFQSEIFKRKDWDLYWCETNHQIICVYGDNLFINDDNLIDLPKNHPIIIARHLAVKNKLLFPHPLLNENKQKLVEKLEDSLEIINKIKIFDVFFINDDFIDKLKEIIKKLNN